MEVKNLTELFAEFKKYYKTKKNIVNKENYDQFVNLTIAYKTDYDTMTITDEVSSMSLNLGEFVNKPPWEKETVLTLDLLGLKKDDWVNYRDKIEKILKDIWTTGEIKDTYGLDLDWPANQQTSENKKTNIKSSKQSPKENTETLELEIQVQELKTKIEQLEKEKKFYWIIIGLVLVSLVGLIASFVFKNHKPKKKQ